MIHTNAHGNFEITKVSNTQFTIAHTFNGNATGNADGNGSTNNLT